LLWLNPDVILAASFLFIAVKAGEKARAAKEK
jgi:hypothetical protein